MGDRPRSLLGRGATNDIRTDPRGFMDVCELGIRVYDA
jgi:hypothetical protein